MRYEKDNYAFGVSIPASLLLFAVLSGFNQRILLAQETGLPHVLATESLGLEQASATLLDGTGRVRVPTASVGCESERLPNS